MVNETSVDLKEVKQAIQIVEALMANVSIPGNRASKWAIACEILAELSFFVDESIKAAYPSDNLQESAGSSDDITPDTNPEATSEETPEPSADI